MYKTWVLGKEIKTQVRQDSTSSEGTRPRSDVGRGCLDEGPA